MATKSESNPKKSNYKLQVPLDASGIEDFKPDRPVKVAVKDREGEIQSQLVKFDAKGQGTAMFGFRGNPGGLNVAVGPADASDQEIFGLQTLSQSVSARIWSDPLVTLTPLVIRPFYWYWWRRWCRDFTVRGRVVCPDGRPVPGAKVCAFDVDAFWTWSSKQLVGCATTDAGGVFELKFRWCCGWWPWWWWSFRQWHLEPFLIERLLPELEREPGIGPIPLPDPVPDIGIFEKLLGDDQFSALNLTRHLPTATTAIPATTKGMELAPVTGELTSVGAAVKLDPSVLADLREPLVAKLPRSIEFERLRLWPWWPWQPWWDCNPDLIFRVTQDCASPGTVILDEDYGQARNDIPTSLDVTLVANNEACCLPDQGDDPEGNCAVVTNVCNNPINLIGGNPGAPPTPQGYLSPGVIATTGDRPYGGAVRIQGQVGNAVDYYEFQWSADGGATWNDMQTSAVGDIPRQYWIPATNTFQWVPFLTTIDGRLVYESRQHYEATNSPGSWGTTRFWMAANYLSLMNWLTQTPFLNGPYQLRIRGWQLVGGHLVNQQNLDFLPTCDTQTPAQLVLQIDNRLEGVASGHPMADPDHPCGAGTVHTCTREPDTDFLGVRIVHRDNSGIPTGVVTPVGACGNVPIGPQDLLQVDFLAHDPEGHLSLYSLQATYRENLARPLLSLPGMSLTPLGGAPVPAAVQVGPTYANARSANPPPAGGAVAPIWRGGAIRYEVLASLAFPETCCYQLELRAHKRTVVSCNHSLWGHTNYSEYGFMIVV